MTDVDSEIWVEKHRPESMDEVIGHPDITHRFQQFLHDDEMPNILLEGPQGTGKTAVVTAFAKEKYGEDAWRNNVLEMNASDERGIDDIRTKVKSFARQGTVGNHQYKIIFLDEVDSTTKDAQAAMRRIMEDYSDKTRFFLSCNYANQIIEPIQSRCVTFRFGRLDDSDIRELLERVAEKEGVDYTDEGLDLLVDEASGDARKAIHSLWVSSIDGRVDEENVSAVVSTLDFNLVREILNKAASGNIDEAMSQLDDEVLKEGVSEQKFLNKALGAVKTMDIPADAKTKCIDKVAECDWRIINGANPHVQLHSLLADIHVARHMSLPNYEENDD